MILRSTAAPPPIIAWVNSVLGQKPRAVSAGPPGQDGRSQKDKEGYFLYRIEVFNNAQVLKLADYKNAAPPGTTPTEGVHPWSAPLCHATTFVRSALFLENLPALSEFITNGFKTQYNIDVSHCLCSSRKIEDVHTLTVDLRISFSSAVPPKKLYYYFPYGPNKASYLAVKMSSSPNGLPRSWSRAWSVWAGTPPSEPPKDAPPATGPSPTPPRASSAARNAAPSQQVRTVKATSWPTQPARGGETTAASSSHPPPSTSTETTHTASETSAPAAASVGPNTSTAVAADTSAPSAAPFSAASTTAAAPTPAAAAADTPVATASAKATPTDPSPTAPAASNAAPKVASPKRACLVCCTPLRARTGTTHDDGPCRASPKEAELSMLDSRLTKVNLQRHVSPADGRCFFHSVRSSSGLTNSDEDIWCGAWDLAMGVGFQASYNPYDFQLLCSVPAAHSWEIFQRVSYAPLDPPATPTPNIEELIGLYVDSIFPHFVAMFLSINIYTITQAGRKCHLWSPNSMLPKKVKPHSLYETATTPGTRMAIIVHIRHSGPLHYDWAGFPTTAATAPVDSDLAPASTAVSDADAPATSPPSSASPTLPTEQGGPSTPQPSASVAPSPNPPRSFKQALLSTSPSATATHDSAADEGTWLTPHPRKAIKNGNKHAVRSTAASDASPNSKTAPAQLPQPVQIGKPLRASEAEVHHVRSSLKAWPALKAAIAADQELHDVADTLARLIFKFRATFAQELLKTFNGSRDYTQAHALLSSSDIIKDLLPHVGNRSLLSSTPGHAST